MVSADALWTWRAVDLAAAIRSRRISSREVVESVLIRCDSVNPRISAVVDLMAEEALAAADAADAAVARGEPLGPLHGIPVTFKINVDFAGRATTDGVVAFKDRVATADSSPVRNWKAAGAICIGRTNVPAFSARYFCDNSLHGRTVNPRATDRTPGGSSGGAAAAVASGLGALAHGNDRAGSIRYPAYACGVFGLRPSFGRLPGYNPTMGNPKLTSQFTNVQGPLARSIADLRLGFQTLAAADTRDPWHTPAPLDIKAVETPCRVALFSTDSAGAAVAPEVLQALDRAARVLADAGYEIEHAAPPYFEEAAALFFSLVKTEEAGSAGILERFGDDALKRARASTMAHAVQFDLIGYVEAMQKRTALLREWQLFIEHYPIILMPVSRQLPFPIDTDQKGDEAVSEIMTAQAPLLAISMLGLPALAAPIGVAGGVPIGVQLVAGRFQEELCLAVGSVLESSWPVRIALDQ